MRTIAIRGLANCPMRRLLVVRRQAKSGAAPAKNVTVRFEGPTGALLVKRVIPLLEAPLDLDPRTAVVWLPQPLLFPLDRIVVRVDPDGAINEITDENNWIVWER